MVDSERQKIVQQAKALGRLYSEQSIDLSVYGKWTVKLAHELMVADELQLAVGICMEVPDQYFQELLVDQILDDEEFGRMSEYLATRFKVHGVVDADIGINILSRIGIG